MNRVRRSAHEGQVEGLSMLLLLPLLTADVCAQIGSAKETVLAPSSSISVAMANQRISVKAETDTVRVFKFNECEFRISASPWSERSQGSYGISRSGYEEGRDFKKRMLLTGCQQLKKPLFREAQVHLPNEGFALEWLRRQVGSADGRAIVGPGLLMTWQYRPALDSVSVDIYRACVNGRPVEFDKLLPQGEPDPVRVAMEGSILPCAAVPQKVATDTALWLRRMWREGDRMQLDAAAHKVERNTQATPP